MEAVVRNDGTDTSEPIKMQFDGLADHAEIIGCEPSCETDEFFGAYFATFDAGIEPDETITYEVEFLARSIGVVDWTLMMYEGADNDFYFGSGKTVIR